MRGSYPLWMGEAFHTLKWGCHVNIRAKDPDLLL